MTDWSAIAEHIGAATGEPFKVGHEHSVGGGCINTAHVLRDGARIYFVKLNSPDRRDMFESEAAGLRALAEPRAIRVPAPICTGASGRSSYLVMELLDLRGRLDGARAGRELAALHRTSSTTFGWHRGNTIGSTPQQNQPMSSWVEFWRDQRLGYQLRLAASRGYVGKLQAAGERLMARLGALIDHQPVPSLLHGDLWGGNIGATPEGDPVIYDPAVYYGDREADIAMTELFGGFGPAFYAAYREAWPLHPGYDTRKTLYNLYHVLNHLNLFGGGYLSQAQSMIDRLLSAVR